MKKILMGNKFLVVIVGALWLMGCSPEEESSKATDDPQFQLSQGDTVLLKRAEKVISNSSEDKINAFNAMPDDDTSTMRDTLLAEMRNALPLLIDDSTLLQDITESDGLLTYQYVIKGIPDEILNSDSWKRNMAIELKNNYCVPGNIMKLIQSTFPKGVYHQYYKADKLIFTHQISPEECNL